MRFILLYLLLTLFYSCASKNNPTETKHSSANQRKEVEKTKKPFIILGYFRGKLEEIEKYDYSKMTHVAFCFTYLVGNKIVLKTPEDEQILLQLIKQKEKFPDLKVLVSFGGWGGCETCSDVFFTEVGRKEFVQSVQEMIEKYKVDGIDLDWESPVIGGYKNHKAQPKDKDNFTSLVKELRKSLPEKSLICFDANSFRESLERSFDWKEIVPLVDWINLMTYTLPENYRRHTNPHTALYSSKDQTESVDYAVKYLDSIGVPKEKIVIGAAFYGMMCEGVDSLNHGLYREGKLKSQPTYMKIATDYLSDKQYTYHWDSLTHSPYLYNAKENYFITYDDTNSVALKTKYAYEEKLGGIMFWKLNGDIYKNGLLDAINKEYKKLIGE